VRRISTSDNRIWKEEALLAYLIITTERGERSRSKNAEVQVFDAWGLVGAKALRLLIGPSYERWAPQRRDVPLGQEKPFGEENRWTFWKRRPQGPGRLSPEKHRNTQKDVC